jgi:hypothetical protein
MVYMILLSNWIRFNYPSSHLFKFLRKEILKNKEFKIVGYSKMQLSNGKNKVNFH